MHREALAAERPRDGISLALGSNSWESLILGFFYSAEKPGSCPKLPQAGSLFAPCTVDMTGSVLEGEVLHLWLHSCLQGSCLRPLLLILALGLLGCKMRLGEALEAVLGRNLTSECFYSISNGPPVQPSLAFLLFEYHEGCTQPPPPPPSVSSPSWRRCPLRWDKQKNLGAVPNSHQAESLFAPCTVDMTGSVLGGRSVALMVAQLSARILSKPSLAFLLFEYHEGCTQPPPPPPSGSPHLLAEMPLRWDKQ
ncbi:hypothetical protein E2320_009423, partial [Naja naja]